MERLEKRDDEGMQEKEEESSPARMCGRVYEKEREREREREREKSRELESRCRVGGPITLRFRAQEQHVQPGNKTLSFKAEAKPR